MKKKWLFLFLQQMFTSFFFCFRMIGEERGLTEIHTQVIKLVRKQNNNIVGESSTSTYIVAAAAAVSCHTNVCVCMCERIIRDITSSTPYYTNFIQIRIFEYARKCSLGTCVLVNRSSSLMCEWKQFETRIQLKT